MTLGPLTFHVVNRLGFHFVLQRNTLALYSNNNLADARTCNDLDESMVCFFRVLGVDTTYGKENIWQYQIFLREMQSYISRILNCLKQNKHLCFRWHCSFGLNSEKVGVTEYINIYIYIIKVFSNNARVKVNGSTSKKWSWKRPHKSILKVGPSTHLPPPSKETYLNIFL